MKLLKTTTDGAVSKKSSEIHLKLDKCQLNRISVDTSGLLATWPELWALGLSFLGFTFNFALLIICPSCHRCREKADLIAEIERLDDVILLLS